MDYLDILRHLPLQSLCISGAKEPIRNTMEYWSGHEMGKQPKRGRNDLRGGNHAGFPSIEGNATSRAVSPGIRLRVLKPLLNTKMKPAHPGNVMASARHLIAKTPHVCRCPAISRTADRRNKTYFHVTSFRIAN